MGGKGRDAGVPRQLAAFGVLGVLRVLFVDADRVAGFEFADDRRIETRALADDGVDAGLPASGQGGFQGPRIVARIEAEGAPPGVEAPDDDSRGDAARPEDLETRVAGRRARWSLDVNRGAGGPPWRSECIRRQRSPRRGPSSSARRSETWVAQVRLHYHFLFESSDRLCHKKSVHSSRTRREMSSRPKT